MEKGRGLKQVEKSVCVCVCVHALDEAGILDGVPHEQGDFWGKFWRRWGRRVFPGRGNGPRKSPSPHSVPGFSQELWGDTPGQVEGARGGDGHRDRDESRSRSGLSGLLPRSLFFYDGICKGPRPDGVSFMYPATHYWTFMSFSVFQYGWLIGEVFT